MKNETDLAPTIFTVNLANIVKDFYDYQVNFLNVQHDKSTVSDLREYYSDLQNVVTDIKMICDPITGFDTLKQMCREGFTCEFFHSIMPEIEKAMLDDGKVVILVYSDGEARGFLTEKYLNF